MIIGIDPGLKGGVAGITGHALSICAPMPLIAGKDLDLPRLRDMINGARLIVIERQQAMPKQGVSSTFRTGVNYGKLVGLCLALDMSHIVVRPQAWKASILKGTAKDKAAAIGYVLARWPAADLRPGKARKHHDGMADAVCIAAYGAEILAQSE